MLTEDLLMRRRTPKELRAFAAEVVADGKANKAEIIRAYRMAGPYRQFRNEVIPLAGCVERLYGEDRWIEPVPGNQGFDFRVFDAADILVDRIEVAHPHQGRERSISERQAVDEGISVRSLESESIPALRATLIATCVEKAQKDYSDSTLLIVMDWEELHWLFDDAGAQEAFHEGVISEISALPFRARRVFLYNGITDQLASIFAIASTDERRL